MLTEVPRNEEDGKAWPTVGWADPERWAGVWGEKWGMAWRPEVNLRVRERLQAGGQDGRAGSNPASWYQPPGPDRKKGLASCGLGRGLCCPPWGFLPSPAGQSLSLASSSSVATRIEQRKKMNCKSFRWYLDNVYPELTWVQLVCLAWVGDLPPWDIPILGSLVLSSCQCLSSGEGSEGTQGTLPGIKNDLW